MAEVKNAFIQSKMNKDLDARLVPNGEYRNAINAQISRSEGSDVGALENALGNSVQATFEDGQSYSNNLTCIGYVADETSNCIYVFLTDGTRVGGDAFVTAGNSGSNHFIYKYNTNSPAPPVKIVSGAFLNFSKNYPIYGINLIENLLFWTDNFNQPRKINVATASNPDNVNTYYTTEDQISVASYNPYQPIELYQQIDTERVADNPLLTPALNEYDTTMRDVVSKFYPGGGTANVVTGVTNSTTVSIDQINIPFLPTKQGVSAVKTPQTSMTVGVIAASTNGSGPIVSSAVPILVSSYSSPTLTLQSNITVNTGDTLVFNFNPYYDNSYAGDSRFLEDKFVRFSYRFNFDDGEYSIYAPFTQPCFIPQQDGYFLNTEQNLGDQQSAFASTIVDFMKNKVSEITLRIPLPSAANSIASQYLVKEVDILFKESDGLAVQVVETVPVSRIAALSGSDTYHDYKYINKKPFKTLPESELIRVFDKVPVRALSQETASNRVIYGNFQNKHTPPATLDYRVSVGEKKTFDLDPTYSVLDATSIIEYPSSSVKTNRTYQVGVVLSDRFGRQSSVILSNNKNVINVGGLSFSGDTVYSPYIDGSNISGEFYEWLGNSLKMSFNSVIGPNRPNTNTYEPGVYNGDINSTDYNPLGWYSYKIVVKQQEQEYYNVYTAGAMKGLPYNYDNDSVGPVLNEDISFVTLLNDNINKVPRDLTEVGPQDKTFRSSVKLFGRVENTTNTFSNTGNKQYEPKRFLFTTNNIEDLYDLFDVLDFENNVNSKVPVTSDLNPFHPFYKSDSNPFVAEFVTSQTSNFQFGVNNQSTSNTVGTAEVNEPSGSLVGSTVLNINELDPGFAPSSGELVTGINIVTGTFVVSYDGTNGDLTLSKAQPVIANDTVLTFSDVTHDDIQNLAILETAPTISNLDIYWETSSAGLISELNEAIRNSANSTEADIAPFNDSAFEEDLSVGEDILAADFQVIDAGTGAAIDTTLVTLTTESITYAGDEALDASQILEVYETGTPGSWNIRTLQGFVDNIWYGDNPNDRNFIINISVSVENKGSADVDGVVTNSTNVFIDNLTANFIPAIGATVTGGGLPSGVEVVSYDNQTFTLVLNTAVNLNDNETLTIKNGQPSVTQITKTVSLDNQPPKIFDGYDPQGALIPDGDTIDLTVIPFKNNYTLKSLSGVNGANIANAGNDLDFLIVDVIGAVNAESVSGNFNIIKNSTESTTSLVAADLVLSSISGLDINDTYTATVNLKDAGGEESSIAFTFGFGTTPSSISTMSFIFNPSDPMSGEDSTFLTFTVITINDQPGNDNNGIYYYKGSPGSLINNAENNVITIDRTNASIGQTINNAQEITCSTTEGKWAFANENDSGDVGILALSAASQCLASGNNNITSAEPSTELNGFSFQVV